MYAAARLYLERSAGSGLGTEERAEMAMIGADPYIRNEEDAVAVIAFIEGILTIPRRG